jgi:hypothetical protein
VSQLGSLSTNKTDPHKRRCCPIKAVTSVGAAVDTASTNPFASSEVPAIGFSTNTSIPACNSSIPGGTCVAEGVAIFAASTFKLPSFLAAIDLFIVEKQGTEFLSASSRPNARGSDDCYQAGGSFSRDVVGMTFADQTGADNGDANGIIHLVSMSGLAMFTHVPAIVSDCSDVAQRHQVCQQSIQAGSAGRRSAPWRTWINNRSAPALFRGHS